MPGVAQAQINPAVGFDLATGLRSMLRQDPEVIAVGEIRDLATAEVAFQASLTGHLVLCTFHAGSGSGVLGRLAEMGIEPYVISSGIRRDRLPAPCPASLLLCPPVDDPIHFLGLDVSSPGSPSGCDVCRGTGYRGRISLAEILSPRHPEISQAIRAQADVNQLEAVALKSGYDRPPRTRPPHGRGRSDRPRRNPAQFLGSRSRPRPPSD